MLDKMNEFFLDKNVQIAQDVGRYKNIYDILELGETRHSKMLAWLLNPTEGHMQGDYFIKSLLREVLRQKQEVNNTFLQNWDAADIEAYNFNGAISCTELAISENSKRKIDVAVIDHSTEVAIFIENKTGSGEGKDQTPEYFKELSSEYEAFAQVFVFMDMYEGQAKDEGNWVNVDYDWLEEAIESLLRKNVLDAETRVILDQYRASLAQDKEKHPFFKQPYERLSLIANEHKDFLGNLEEECGEFKLSMLSDYENHKVLSIYKKHEVFFGILFDFTGIEYWLEQVSKELNTELDSDIKNKGKFYIQHNDWLKYYKDEDWGILPCIQEVTSTDEAQNKTSTYNLKVVIQPKFFNKETQSKATEEALKLQTKLGKSGSVNITILTQDNLQESNMVEALVTAVKKVNKFLKKLES